MIFFLLYADRKLPCIYRYTMCTLIYNRKIVNPRQQYSNTVLTAHQFFLSKLKLLNALTNLAKKKQITLKEKNFNLSLNQKHFKIAKNCKILIIYVIFKSDHFCEFS